MIYKILVKNSDKTQTKEFEINIVELRKKGNVYDSLLIDETGKVEIIRRIGYYQGQTYILTHEYTENYKNINIELFDGINYISIQDENSLIISVGYILKNEFTDKYATKVELASRITQTANSILSVVSSKIGEDELGTLIEQNPEAIRVAWNQISEDIKFTIINQLASLAISKGENNLMWLDRNGMHFNKDESDTILGSMGVERVDEDNYIAFSLPIDYNEETADGMAWGVTAKEDGQFYPILYLRNFALAPKQSGASYGELVLQNSDLVFSGTDTGIKSGDVLIHKNALQGVTFETTSGSVLLAIYPPSSANPEMTLTMLGGAIDFFRNVGGTHTFNIGDKTASGNTGNSYARMTDGGNVTCSGNMKASDFVRWSKEEYKENIKKYNKSALDIIQNTDIYEYNYKKDKETKNIGVVIGEKYKCAEEIINKDKDGIDMGNMLAIAYKAIQEQQEEIEKLREEVQRLKNVMDR